MNPINFPNKIITFVIPWYGSNLMGGAESLCKNTAENFKKLGYNVEVFTTCSKSFHDNWSNYYNEGITTINEIKVHRFSVDKRDQKLFDDKNYKILNKIPITHDDEIDFISNSINSSTLIQQIISEKNQRIFIFLPYLYGITYFGCNAVPENSFMIPCLHDEGYAYFKIFKNTFSKINGLIFNSKPEQLLAEKIFQDLPPFITPGVGVDNHTFSPNSIFSKKFKIDNYILYVGKKDQTKNVLTLVEYFCKYIAQNNSNLHLVLSGRGNMEIPKKFKHRIHDFVLSDEDLFSAYSSALVTCQPSLNESFSFTIMESWLSSTPVIVHEDCDVTKYHCDQSNGGLYFSNYEEFEECVNFLTEHKEERKLMANNGKKYVIENFGWEKIIEKYSKFIKNQMST